MTNPYRCAIIYESAANSQDKAIVMATRPLDRDKWKNVPMNQLLAYEDGKLIYTGTKHEYEFVDSEEKMHMLFLDFANL